MEKIDLKVDKIVVNFRMGQKPGSGGSGTDFELGLHWIPIEIVSIFIEKVVISTLSTLRPRISGTSLPNPLKPDEK